MTAPERTSEDAYVSRMRPTFGYVMALTWLAQMGAIAWVIVADPIKESAVAAVADLRRSGIHVVLGIYVYRRSGDKRVSARGPER